MYEPLAPCPSCSRHVRTAETSCPFCKSALPDTMATLAVPGAPQRLSRAAAFAFTASLAVTGCGGTSSPVVGDSGTGDGSTRDAAKDGPADDGGNVALYGEPAYGQPFIDAGPQDSGGGGAKYGGPPIDAGNNG